MVIVIGVNTAMIAIIKVFTNILNFMNNTFAIIVPVIVVILQK